MKSWGDRYSIGNNQLVSGSTEIPAQNYAYVFNKQTTTESYVPIPDWESMVNGDMSFIRDRIEQGIPGAQVMWVMIAWDKAEVRPLTQYPHNNTVYCVQGFQTEALVYNKGSASLTGLEIVAIIMAIAFLAAVLTVLALGAWIILQVMDAAKQIGPWATIGLGLVILGGLGLGLFLMFGGKAEYRGKKRRIRLGR
jgi:hypothetical protein